MTSNDEALMRELMETFRVEAAEHIQNLNQYLLKLERQPEAAVAAALIQDAFRAAHSLKGAARAVGLKAVEALAHRVEDVLKAAREHKLQLNSAVCDVLYTALDMLQAMVDGSERDTITIEQQLAALLPQNGGAPQTTSPSQPGISANETESETITAHHATQRASGEGDDTIRVSIRKLDALMAQAGELLIARISAEQRTEEIRSMRQQMNRYPRLWRDIRAAAFKLGRHSEEGQRLIEMLTYFDEYLHNISHHINKLDNQLNRDSLRMGMVAEQIQTDMRRLRMIPFYTLESYFERLVRDAARAENKQVTLTLQGGAIEVDKKVLEALKDTFIHLLRNAVSHGIETPQARVAAGKSETGHIAIAITQRGSEAHITISDDGAGFDLNRLRKAAIANGLNLSPDASDDDVLNTAFHAGISTSEQITALSGRGVGLDVVRKQIETLQGRIIVQNRPGQGSTFQLIVPVSLALTRVLIVSVANQRYALPLASVEKITALKGIISVEGIPMIVVNHKPLPLLSLASIMSLRENENSAREGMAIIMGAAEQRVALLVDDVLTELELAVKPLSKPITRMRYVSGAALLGSGEPIVVLNTADLVKAAHSVHAPRINTLQPEQKQAEAVRILVVDDSITTRTLEKNILEAAGYEVQTATDGVQAVHQLKTRTPALVVADVEMPNMDGIALTQYIRDTHELREIPIILVTSLESPEDRQRGMMAGANAYIVKRGFNQAELLSTIKQFLSI